MPAEFVDPYIDPDFDVLRNLVGATTYDELANAEGEYVSLRTAELLGKKHPNLTGSLDDFKYLHRAIFKDIFDWAGEIRTVEIKKNSEGSEYFLPSSRIEQGFAWSQEQLKNDAYLLALGKGEFVERLAFHYDNYNYIHPFREGNGRTQRLFWSLLCLNASWDINWTEVSSEENDHASKVAAETKNLELLIKMFDRVCCTCDSNSQGLSSDFALNHLI